MRTSWVFFSLNKCMENCQKYQPHLVKIHCIFIFKQFTEKNIHLYLTISGPKWKLNIKIILSVGPQKYIFHFDKSVKCYVIDIFFCNHQQ